MKHRIHLILLHKRSTIYDKTWPIEDVNFSPHLYTFTFSSNVTKKISFANGGQTFFYLSFLLFIKKKEKGSSTKFLKRLKRRTRKYIIKHIRDGYNLFKNYIYLWFWRCKSKYTLLSRSIKMELWEVLPAIKRYTD